ADAAEHVRRMVRPGEQQNQIYLCDVVLPVAGDASAQLAAFRWELAFAAVAQSHTGALRKFGDKNRGQTPISAVQEIGVCPRFLSPNFLKRFIDCPRPAELRRQGRDPREWTCLLFPTVALPRENPASCSYPRGRRTRKSCSYCRAYTA